MPIKKWMAALPPAAGFGLLMACLLALAALTTYCLQQTRAGADRALQARYLKAQMAMQLLVNTNVQGRQLRQAVLAAGDAVAVRSALTAAERLAEANTLLLTRLLESEDSVRGKALMRTILDTREASCGLHQQVGRLLAGGQPGAASALLLRAPSAVPAYQDALQAMAEFQQQQWSHDSEQALTARQRGQGQALLLAALAVAAAGMAGWRMARQAQPSAVAHPL